MKNRQQTAHVDNPMNRIAKTWRRIKAASLTVRAIWDTIATSPRCRLAVTITCTVLVTIFSGVYAIQIAPNGVVTWSKVFQVSSFWPLMIVAVVWLLIHLSFLGRDEARDRAIELFADDQHCLAFVRRTNLEAYAIRVKANPRLARDARVVLEELGVKMQ